uniref:Uncharacterized protein n=1 Tax=Lactuca sativa TaxID=4236 RepID=A0A9R1WA73_LACSA|nr:hypothetical protein LSAT_V11C300131750 [Lactuca sativa]
MNSKGDGQKWHITLYCAYKKARTNWCILEMRSYFQWRVPNNPIKVTCFIWRAKWVEFLHQWLYPSVVLPCNLLPAVNMGWLMKMETMC